MAFKPIDNKRDQFRKYLESSGVIEVLSKSITKLMESPEKPESPVEFIRENMGLSQKEHNKIEFLKEEVEAYKRQVDDLKKEIAGLKMERKEVENTLTNEAIHDDVKIEIVDVTEIQSVKLNNEDEKKLEDIQQQSIQVSDSGKIAIDEISNDNKSIEVPSITTNEEKVVETVAAPLVGDVLETTEKEK